MAISKVYLFINFSSTSFWISRFRFTVVKFTIYVYYNRIHMHMRLYTHLFHYLKYFDSFRWDFRLTAKWFDFLFICSLYEYLSLRQVARQNGSYSETTLNPQTKETISSAMYVCSFYEGDKWKSSVFHYFTIQHVLRMSRSNYIWQHILHWRISSLNAKIKVKHFNR